MANMITRTIMGFTLGASMLVAAAPAAEAQRYRDRHYRGNDNTGTAIVAGIAGLAIGAALAGNNRRDYDRRVYRERDYYPYDRYYHRDHYRRFDGYERCTIRRVYDPYIGRSVPVRMCH